MGLYIGNYSSAQCMYWGRQQGCQFVETRCGSRINDASLELTGWPVANADGGTELPCMRPYAQSLGGDDFVTMKRWRGNAILMSKCTKPRCAELDIDGPFRETPRNDGTQGPTGKCNAECFDERLATTQQIDEVRATTWPTAIAARGCILTGVAVYGRSRNS
jgi:hypothetical protein